jgi:hypothetical protein
LNSFNRDNNQILYIFIDSESIDRSISNKEGRAEALLAYNTEKIFKFFRSPFNTSYKNLVEISSFEIQKDIEGNTIKELTIKDSNDSEPTYVNFPFTMKNIEEFAKDIFKKESPSENEKETILLVLIHHIFISFGIYNGESIYVTNNKKLLKNRLWFQLHLSSKIEILQIEEALEIMDLFAKAQGKYYLRPYGTADKKGWYWLSFRSKVPHYHVPYRAPFEKRNILEAFASRFTYLLMSIDEIGIRYLWLKDKDITIPYHFNYFISLITGIFDNLAIVSKEKYQIKLQHDYPNRTSLSNTAGAEFLQSIKKYSSPLHSHIHNYREFINLMYELREVSIHREAFRDVGYTQNKKFALFFVIDQKIACMIKRCGDKLLYGNAMTNWGMINDSVVGVLLEPYHFAKAAGLKLVDFSDEYLRLLGFSRYIDTLTQKNSYVKEIKLFEQYSLDGQKCN